MKRPMTPRGYNALREELQKLKAMRPELAAAIELARSHGDLSENADYDAARDKSGFVEAKIRDIETKLTNAQVIDPRKLGTISRVVFGVSVRIEDMDSGDERVIHLVGSDESDVEKSRISVESPLGRALIGKESGDAIRVELPAGAKEYQIVEFFVSQEEYSDLEG